MNDEIETLLHDIVDFRNQLLLSPIEVNSQTNEEKMANLKERLMMAEVKLEKKRKNK